MLSLTLLVLFCAACFFGVGLLIIVVLWLRSRPKAEDGWQVFATRCGLVFSPDPRLVTGQYRGRDLKLEAFYSFNPFGADTSGTKMTVSVKNPLGWHLTAETGAGIGRLGGLFGVEQIKLGVDELDKKFTFRSQPPELAPRLLLTPALHQYLAATPHYVKLTLEGETLHESPLDEIKDSGRLLMLANWLCSTAETLEALAEQPSQPRDA
jgi:hypothetical protein